MGADFREWTIVGLNSYLGIFEKFVHNLEFIFQQRFPEALGDRIVQVLAGLAEVEAETVDAF